MKFLISRPRKIEGGISTMDLSDMKQFYDNLQEVILEDGHTYEITLTEKRKIKFDGIYLSWHTMFNDKNIWNIKKGYVPGYAYFDRRGYSGWAEMASRKDWFDESQSIDINHALHWFDSFSSEYIKSNNSKVEQNDTPVELPDKYVFIASQIPNDTVLKLADINAFDLIHNVSSYFKRTHWKIVMKPHPLAQPSQRKKFKALGEELGMIISDGSIHDLIFGSDAVFVVNSGVGFESLFHRKKVFCSGLSDYHWVVNRINNETLKKDILHLMEVPVNDSMIIKFMYYMMNEYFVKSFCKNSIRRKLNLAIKEFC